MRKSMKKSVGMLIAALFVLGACGCAGGVSYNPELPQKPVDDYKQYLNQKFNSTESLSDCQGYENWYYYCGDPEIDMLYPMVFNSYYGRWCSRFSDLYYFSYMWGTAWMPDGVNGYGIGMGFKAPATGTVNVTAKVELLEYPELSSGDGVVFTISDKVGTEYDSILINKEDGAKEIVLETLVEVAMDEEILFMLYANSNNTHDATNVDITIEYVEA